MTDMIPRVNIICRKASAARGFWGQSPLRKFLGSKEHLDWFKTDLNAAKIRTVQDYISTKN